jgi:Flp pilus assembly pilin Flp
VKIFSQLFHNETGATLSKYGLIVAVLAVIVATTVLAIVNNIN